MLSTCHLTLSLTSPTSIGWAVSIVQSCRASQGSSGKAVLVAKSLAVPIGITPMARDFGASNLTSALATCTVAQAGRQQTARRTVPTFGQVLSTSHPVSNSPTSCKYLIDCAIATSSHYCVDSRQCQRFLDMTLSIRIFPSNTHIYFVTFFPEEVAELITGL